MRTVRGRVDHVVVVGAGLGGLSAALRLAGAGRQVTVLEREDVPGGRAGVLVDGSYTFDTGPTVLTMPELLADALGCVGERLPDWLKLEPVSPLYRARFADGSTIDVHADPDVMAEEITRVCGPSEADGYRRFVRFATAMYRLQMRTFIDRNTDSPLSLLGPELVRLAAMGGFRRLATKIGRYLRDPRTTRLYSFQAMYAGLSPYNALALYAVISYLDGVAGVYFARGGMHAAPGAEMVGTGFRRSGSGRSTITAPGATSAAWPRRYTCPLSWTRTVLVDLPKHPPTRQEPGLPARHQSGRTAVLFEA
jgi:phytoene desaturase